MTRTPRAVFFLVAASFSLLLGASGCGPVVVGGGSGEDPDEQGQGQQPGDPGEPGQEPGQGPSAPSCGGELHILGVYETHGDHSGADNHPPGAATVHVARQGSQVLALSSYEPVHWTVTADPGAVIEKVIINGYHAQTADVPAGVPVEIHAESGTLGVYGYAWPSSEGGSDTQGLVSALEQLAGRQMTSFHGCYQATSFVLHDDLSVSAACTEDAGYYLTGHVDSSCGPQDPPPDDPCAGASGTAEYVGWYCDYGYPMIITQDISCAEALANCQLNSASNPDLSLHCTWGGQPIHESEVSAGACDWLSDP